MSNEPEEQTEPRRIPSGDETWEALKRRVGRSDLEPLVERLASLLRNMPTDDALKRFADRSPDKWVGAVKGLATLVGYAEKRELDINVNVSVAQMSDSQLEAALAATLQEVASQLVGATAEHMHASGSQQPAGSQQIARNPPPRAPGSILDVVAIELADTSPSANDANDANEPRPASQPDPASR